MKSIAGHCSYLSWHLLSTAGWVKLGKHGVAYRKLQAQGLYFSERNGYVKFITAFGWLIKIV